MNTQGEIESAICDGISRFEQEFMGREPRDISVHLLGDLVVVRLQGMLTLAEQQLAKSHPTASGRDLLKGARTLLIESARPTLQTLIEDAVHVNVLTLHHDFSTVTGEEVLLFTLDEAPLMRSKEQKEKLAK